MSAMTFRDFLIQRQIEDPRPPVRKQAFSICKTVGDKRLVFGWASIAVTVDGEQLEDRQHDLIDPEALEEAAYEYVLNFGDTGEEHIPTMRKKGKLVESFISTREKQKAMGLPEGTIPEGWWIGFKIEDEDTWERVKNGTYKMFSIEGKAERVPVEKAEKNYEDYPGYDEWLEENLDATLGEQKDAKDWYQTRQAARDRAAKSGTQEPTGCGVLVLRDGKVLAGTRIERNGRGRLCGPGGHIEEGETPEDAAVREAEEEFGIICHGLELLGVQDGGGRYGTSAVFLCTSYEGKPRCDEREMTDPRWLNPAEIRDHENVFPPFLQSLELLPVRKTARSFQEVLATLI